MTRRSRPELLLVLVSLYCALVACSRSGTHSPVPDTKKPRTNVVDAFSPDTVTETKATARNPSYSRLTIVTVPADTRVYVGPASLRKAAKNAAYGFSMSELFIGSTYLRGEAPLTVDLPPGKYQIGVATKTITDDAKAFDKKWFSEPGKTRLKGSESISRKGSADLVESIFNNRQLVMVGKILQIAVNSGEDQALNVALFDF